MHFPDYGSQHMNMTNLTVRSALRDHVDPLEGIELPNQTTDRRGKPI